MPTVDAAHAPLTDQLRATARQPSLDGLTELAGSGLAALFRTTSRLRSARTFHPRGIVVRAEALVPETQAPAGFPAGRHRVLVRLSRGLGIPGPVPDFLGIAVRFLDAGGPDRHQDLLMATTWSSPVGRKILRPTGDFTDGKFTTLLPYEAEGRRLVFAASLESPSDIDLPDIGELTDLLETRSLDLQLWWADPSGPWQPLTRIPLGPTIDLADPPSLAFDPWNSVGPLRPAGWFNRVRIGAYAGSRSGRMGTTIDAASGPTDD